MNSRIAVAVLALGVCGLPLTADTWNKRTKLTFSGPVQVPAPNTKAGVMVLPPGSYLFKLVSSSGDRHIVQVTNPQGNKVYTTILAISDYRLNASSKTVMYFSERKSGTPVAIKSWFYPGDNFGQRFVYPKAKAAQIAAEVKQPVPSLPAEPIVIEKTKIVEVPVFIQTPAKEEVKYTASAFEKTDATDTQGEDGEAVKEAAPAAKPAPAATADATPKAEKAKALPKTASPLQTVAGIGMVLLALGTLTRRLATRV